MLIDSRDRRAGARQVLQWAGLNELADQMKQWQDDHPLLYGNNLLVTEKAFAAIHQEAIRIEQEKGLREPPSVDPPKSPWGTISLRVVTERDPPIDVGDNKIAFVVDGQMYVGPAKIELPHYEPPPLSGIWKGLNNGDPPR